MIWEKLSFSNKEGCALRGKEDCAKKKVNKIVHEEFPALIKKVMHEDVPAIIDALIKNNLVEFFGDRIPIPLTTSITL